MFSPELTTARLSFHNLGRQHLDFVFAHFSNPEVNHYLVDADPVRSPADAEEIVAFYEDPERNRWVLITKDGGQPVGTLGFVRPPQPLDRSRLRPRSCPPG